MESRSSAPTSGTSYYGHFGQDAEPGRCAKEHHRLGQPFCVSGVRHGGASCMLSKGEPKSKANHLLEQKCMLTSSTSMVHDHGQKLRVALS